MLYHLFDYLQQFSLLPGITAIDDFIRILHQPLYHMKLLLNTRIMPNQLDTETWRNHRQT